MGTSWQCDFQFCISTASKNQHFSGSQYLHENTPHIKSVLLAGPENSGKTMLVRNISLSSWTLYCYLSLVVTHPLHIRKTHVVAELWVSHVTNAKLNKKNVTYSKLNCLRTMLRAFLRTYVGWMETDQPRFWTIYNDENVCI